jgi:hypothetical protein
MCCAFLVDKTIRSFTQNPQNLPLDSERNQFATVIQLEEVLSAFLFSFFSAYLLIFFGKVAQ